MAAGDKARWMTLVVRIVEADGTPADTSYDSGLCVYSSSLEGDYDHTPTIHSAMELYLTKGATTEVAGFYPRTCWEFHRRDTAKALEQIGEVERELRRRAARRK